MLFVLVIDKTAHVRPICCDAITDATSRRHGVCHMNVTYCISNLYKDGRPVWPNYYIVYITHLEYHIAGNFRGGGGG